MKRIYVSGRAFYARDEVCGARGWWWIERYCYARRGDAYPAMRRVSEGFRTRAALMNAKRADRLAFASG